MNSVNLIGRLTKDPDIRYTDKQMCVATFYLAVDRPSKEKTTDFPCIKVFGRAGEAVEKYCKKGKMVAVSGHIQTGSYQNKKGETVYCTDVVADKVEFLGGEEKKPEPPREESQIDFRAIDEAVPF